MGKGDSVEVGKIHGAGVKDELCEEGVGGVRVKDLAVGLDIH